MARWCRRARREAGATTIAYTAVIALSMLTFVLCANAIVAMYGRGVVRGALDEGVRTGSRSTAGATDCLTRVGDVLGDLLGGTMGDGVAVDCAEVDGVIVATADVTFVSWLTGQPLWRFNLSARAVKELDP